MINRIKWAIMRRWRPYKDLQSVRNNTHLIHGPAHVTLGRDEAAIVSLMKNAAYHIREFIEHHQALGISHILIIDNGSTDDTIAIASTYPNVTILQNRLLPKFYECVLRSESAKRVLEGGWVLFVDSDELFEPAAGTLPKLLAYLDQNNYTNMATQMLDLYDPEPYFKSKGVSYAEALKRNNQYSLERVFPAPYNTSLNNPYHWFLTQLQCNEPKMNLKIGGIRHEVFGEWCLLTKHSLVRNEKGINLMIHPHFASNVNVADVSGLLRHYKLSGDYLARDEHSVQTNTWDHEQDLRRLTIAKKSGGIEGFTIRPKYPQQYAGKQPLIDQGFLHVSERYLKFIAA